MRIINLWRKSRFSESHANSLTNGRAKAIYAIAFTMLAVFSLLGAKWWYEPPESLRRVARRWIYRFLWGRNLWFCQYRNATHKRPLVPPSVTWRRRLDYLPAWRGRARFLKRTVTSSLAWRWKHRFLRWHNPYTISTPRFYTPFSVRACSSSTCSFNAYNESRIRIRVKCSDSR